MVPSYCDVLIVGAGPAGSSLAYYLSRKGLRVIIAEKKKKLEEPSRCAGFVPAAFLNLFEDKLDCIIQDIRYMETYIDGEKESVLRSPGYMIDRKKLVEENISKAIKSGCVFLDCAKVESIKSKSRLERGSFLIGISRKKKSLKIISRVIAGAGGAYSIVSSGLLGLGTQTSILGMNQLVKPSKEDDSYNTRVYFSKDITAGYAWIFPRGRYLDFGIGFLKGSKAAKHCKDLFSYHLENTIGSNYSKVTGVHTGLIPAGGIRGKVSGPGIVLIGDEAGLCNPVTGAGIYNAVLSARSVSKLIVETVKTGDVSILRGIRHIYEKEFMSNLSRALEKRKNMQKNWKYEDLEVLVKRCWPAFKDYWK